MMQTVTAGRIVLSHPIVKVATYTTAAVATAAFFPSGERHREKDRDRDKNGDRQRETQ